MRSGPLHHVGKAEIGAESGHKVARSDEIDAGFKGLENQLETSTDLLLAYLADGANLLECAGHAFLPAGDVQTRGGDRVVRATLQVFAVVHLLEQRISSVHNSFRQIDTIRHTVDLAKSIEQSSVGTAHLKEYIFRHFNINSQNIHCAQSIDEKKM